MAIKIGFIYGADNARFMTPAWRTKYFTGSSCYHVGFVDTENNHFYDMNLLFRRRRWPIYKAGSVVLADLPSGVHLTTEYLEHALDTDNNVYGFVDIFLFALRPLLHFFGKSTPNAGGKICSEIVHEILRDCGWRQEYKEVPSPSDLEECLLGKRNYLYASNHD